MGQVQKGTFMQKVWFITGASRGIGFHIARAALQAGHQVVATGRDAQKIGQALGEHQNLLAVTLDVTQPGQVQATVQQAVKHFGRIDVLVNNAGYGLLGAFEEIQPSEIEQQFDTNVFGLLAVTRAVLPHMREQHKGHVFNISSIAGLQGFWGASIYCASKYAVEGFSQGLASEVAPFGIKVVSISPGFFRTDFLEGNSVQYAEGLISEYQEVSKEIARFYGGYNHQQLGDPARLATVLLQLADLDDLPVSLVMGSDAAQMLEATLQSRTRDLNQWKQLSVSTDGQW